MFTCRGVGLKLSLFSLAGVILVATAKGIPPTNNEDSGKGGQAEVSLFINLTTPLFKVSDQFLSVTIDAAAIRENWNVIKFTSPQVINLAKGLSPAMLRVGGTSQDFILFQSSEDRYSRDKEQMSVLTERSHSDTNFTMSPAQWDAVNEFVKAVGWDFIFGLNLLLRHNWPNGSWDSSNAEELLNYTLSKGYTVNWELGNGTEPDLFHDVTTFTVSPEQNAKDHKTLRSLVTEKSPKTQHLAGPDTGSASSYYKSFLQSVEDGVLTAATWHQYYLNGQTAVLPDFFTVSVLDKLLTEAKFAHGVVSEYHHNMELWLGETSSCYHGGAPKLSDTFVAGFMWLDKLGIAALTNHTRVFRQTFVGGSYSLLDSKMDPLPDYWLSLLYKRLVGTTVLNVTGALDTGRYVRAYAHCAKPPYPSGSIVLLVLNVNTYDTNATLLNKELATSPRDVYWFTPPGGSYNITSNEVTLNGNLLHLNGDSLPDVVPEMQTANEKVFLPALSFGFYVFKGSMAKVCS